MKWDQAARPRAPTGPPLATHGHLTGSQLKHRIALNPVSIYQATGLSPLHGEPSGICGLFYGQKLPHQQCELGTGGCHALGARTRGLFNHIHAAAAAAAAPTPLLPLRHGHRRCQRHGSGSGLLHCASSLCLCFSVLLQVLDATSTVTPDYHDLKEVWPGGSSRLSTSAATGLLPALPAEPPCTHPPTHPPTRPAGGAVPDASQRAATRHGAGAVRQHRRR